MKKLLAAILLILALATGCTQLKNDKPDTSHELKAAEALPDILTAARKEGLVPEGCISAGVKRVVDGDTLVVKYKGKEYRVRLLDIDTPESVKKGVSVQAYAKEASAFTGKMVRGKELRLFFEKGLRDRYGRLLAHVVLKDGTYLNAVLVKNGYARAEVLDPNNELEEYFYALQKEAVEHRAGLWALPENKRPFVKADNGDYVPRFWLSEDAG